MKERDFKIYRGDDERGELVSYKCNVSEGMVVLDVIHRGMEVRFTRDGSIPSPINFNV